MEVIGTDLVESSRHRTCYLAAGPEDAPLVIFVHGWPELSISWRHQVAAFAALGFRAVAPDMRGYGRSSAPQTLAAYAQEEIVADMIELLDGLGHERAIWVGHDWGAPVVWNLASHHPDRCAAVAAFSVPYFTLERGIEPLLELIDRELYPADDFPAGQWEYLLEYEERFEQTTAAFDASPGRMVRALFRGADPAAAGKPVFTSLVRREGGWFGGAGIAPDLPLDPRLLDEDTVELYAAALAANGFFGPNAWYMNHAANAEYAGRALNRGQLEMPVLFLAGAYEYTCDCVGSRLAEPMAERCSNLTTVTTDSGHRMSQEKPEEVNATLLRWIAAEVPDAWPSRQDLPPLRV